MKDLDLPLWVGLVMGSPLMGFGMLALGALLVALASRRSGNGRVLASVGAFLSLALALNAAILLSQMESAKQRATRVRETIANHVALQTPQKVAGLMLPAGSVIEWKTGEHKAADVTLSGPVEGLVLVGTLSLEEQSWTGKLGEQHEIDGWMCGVGDIGFGMDGRLAHCELGEARALPTLTVPAGSSIERIEDQKYDPPVPVMKITLAEGVTVAADGVEIPAKSYLTVYPNGSPKTVEGKGDGVRVVGIAMSQEVNWSYAGLGDGVMPATGTRAEYLAGPLAADLRCGGRLVEGQTTVGVARGPGGEARVKVLTDGKASPALVGCLAAR